MEDGLECGRVMEKGAFFCGEAQTMSAAPGCSNNKCQMCNERAARRCTSVLRQPINGRVPIERIVLGDALTLIDTLTVPREYCTALVLKSRLEPNSAIEWAGFRGNSLACTQVLFFDSRRTVAELDRTIMDATVIHHAWTQHSMPRFAQMAKNAAECVCGRERCPGAAARARLLDERIHTAPGLRSTVMPECAPQSACGLVSPSYTRLATAASDLVVRRMIKNQAKGMPTAAEAARLSIAQACAATVGEYWHTYDDTTGYPILLADSETDQKQSVAAGTTPSETEAPVLALLSLDAESVIAAHSASHHKTALCGARLIQLLLLPPEQQTDCDKTLLAKLAGSRAIEPMLVLAREAVAATDPDAHFDDNCACLIHQFIATRCSEQMHLSLVALPTNPLYAEIGDSIFDIASESMRLLLCKQASDALEQQGRLPPGLIDWQAERGSDLHCDTALVNCALLRSTVAALSGPFTYSYDKASGFYEFRSTAPPRSSQVEFARYCQRQKAAGSLYAGICRPAETQRLRGLGTYKAVLEASKRAFGPSVAAAESLTEIALLRGLFGNSELLRSLVRWLPPAAERCVAHAAKLPDDLAVCARKILAIPENKNRILGNACEATLVGELQLSDNRRLALARTTGCFFSGTKTSEDYCDAILYLTAALLVVHQCDELARWLQQEAVASAAGETAAAVKKAEKKPKKKKVRAPKPASEPKPEPQPEPAPEPKPELRPKRQPKQQPKPEEPEPKPEEPKPEEPEPKPEEPKPEEPQIKPKAPRVRQKRERFDQFILRETKVDFFDFLRDPFWINGAGQPVLV